MGGNASQPKDEFQTIVTSLKVAHREVMLAIHPDREYVKYLLEGMQLGFRTGVSRNTPLSSARKNMLSAQEHPQANGGSLWISPT